MKNTMGFILATLLLVGLVVVFGTGKVGIAATEVDIGTAWRLWQQQEAIVIDVRTPAEYRAGHIPGVANIPLDQLSARAMEVPHQGQVLLICRSGNRSAQATKLLREQGWDNVYNITKGMSDWPGPVVKEEDSGK